MVKKILFIFVFTVLLSCGAFALESDDNLHDEIIAAAEKGEQSLISWMKQNKDRVNPGLILALAQRGVDKRLGGLVSIALIMAREKGDKKTSAQVDTLTGNYLFFTRHYQRAIDYYDKALAFFKKSGDPGKLATIYYLKGAAYCEMGDYSNVMDMCEKSGSLYGKVGDLRMQSESDILIALAYADQGDRSKALEILKKALHINEKLEYSPGIAQVCWRMGHIFLHTGETQRALEMLQRALSFYGNKGYELERASVYTEKGNCYFFSGHHDNALEMYEEALVLFEKNKEVWGKGNVYYKMGEIYFSRGNISRALEMYEKALLFFQQTGSDTHQCDVYRGKAYIYSITGNPSRALEMYDKSLQLYKQAGEISGQGAVYLGKADIYRKTGHYEKSLKMYKKALYLFEKIESPWGKGWVYLGRAVVHLAKRHLDIAGAMCQKALTIFKKLGFPQPYADIYLGLGDIYFLKKEYVKALDMYGKAQEIYIKYANIEFRSYLLIKKAAALAMQFRLDESFMLIEESFLYLERFRKKTAFSQMKRTIMEDFYDWYEIVVEFMMDFQYYKRAFKYSEYIKARVFLDQLAEGLVKLEKGINQELLQKRDGLVAKLSLLSKVISQVKDEEKLKKVKKEYQKAENEFEDLLVKIRIENPLYASIQYPEPVTVKDLQRNVLKQGELLLRCFVTKDKTFWFLISKKGFKVIEIKVKEKDIQAMVNRYFIAVTKKDTRKMIEYGKKVYQAIFKPLEASLNRDKDIIIVPDRQLATIPFESFVINNTNLDRPVYLLEKYRIKYIQSASVLATLRKHYSREGKTNHFIGFGDPVYDHENFKQGKPERGAPDPVKGNEIKEIHREKYGREGGQWARLKDSGEEVKVIAQLFKKQNQKGEVYLRENANEEKAKAVDMKSFDYIHFSCHGILGDGFQGLVLSQIPKAKEDGYLTRNEIMNCDYNARLVVLSACQTGKGKMERAEGVTGLTRAVMYAGTPAVVASLWNVSEMGTKELMVKFYKNMLEKGMSKEEALRQAKLEMIKGGRYASPYFWSAFVMYGE